MIAVIDYGMGNVGSIINIFRKIGVDSILTSDLEKIEKADKLILPGVGAFDNGMRNLKQACLTEALRRHTLDKGKPLLGICLGMQLLGRSSEEGTERGFDLISFVSRRFSFSEDIKLKIPHMGWDIAVNCTKKSPLTEGLVSEQRYYFVHSYHAVCDSEENILMQCEYGYPFAAAVRKDNIYGVQFHPEKSHKFGMALLENFAKRV